MSGERNFLSLGDKRSVCAYQNTDLSLSDKSDNASKLSIHAGLRSVLSIVDETGWEHIGTDEFGEIGQMTVFANIDKSSIHAGLRDFDKKC